MLVPLKLSTMLARTCFVVFVLAAVHIRGSRGEEDAPQLLSQDGNLIIKAGYNRNLTLQVNGDDSYVNVGNNNLIRLLESAKNSSRQLERIYNVLYSGSLANDANNNPNVLQAVLVRLAVLESSVRNSTTRPFRNPMRTQIVALRRRVVTLERKLERIENDINRNECASNPCQNGGSCRDSLNGYMCRCPTNWEGPQCSSDVNECSRFAGTGLGCQNGATCLNKPGGYECQCSPGWFGVHCTKRSLDCSGPSEETCGHGTCVLQSSGVGIKCICDQGWKTDGVNPPCNVDINECEASHPPCSVNPSVPCINLPGTFICGSCPAGYTGNGYYCMDINECLTNNGGCSNIPTVQCINTMGSRTCGPCPGGYVGDGVTCTFMGLCHVNNGGCHPFATCSVNPMISSTYVMCSCNPGYTGHGYGQEGCRPGQPGSVTAPPFAGAHCNPNPCVHGICHDLPGGHLCICDTGYSGYNCQNIRDSCSPNPCLNGGTCKNDTNVATGYRCVCPNLYGGPQCGSNLPSCGGVLNTQEGSIVYPDSNATSLYSHNSRCAWVIVTLPNKVLNVTFSQFSLEQSSDCIYDWLQIHDGRNSASMMIGRFCGSGLPMGGNFQSTQNTLYFWFRSDHTIAQDGFSFKWTTVDPVCGAEIETETFGTIKSPGSPGKYPANRDCYWKVEAPENNRLQLHFFTLQIESHPDCRYDYLKIYGGLTTDDSLIGQYCNTTHPPPIITPGPEALIHFHSDGAGSDYGFQLSYTVVEGVPGCGGVYTQDKGELMPPLSDRKYLENIKCEYKIMMPIGSRIKLTFLFLNLEEHSWCSFDYIEVFDGALKEDKLSRRFCGQEIPAPIVSNSNIMTVVFRSDFGINLEGGFVIRYEIVCHETFTAESGVIQSPGYPKTYPANRKCVYEISLPTGKAIDFSFIDFDIEENSFPECIYDYLEIFDGDNENSTSIGRYCGDSTSMPPDLVSTHNYLYLVFQTDQSIGGTGFKANYTSIDLQCGGILKDLSGTVQHPDPKTSDSETYKNSQRCVWVLSAPMGYIIQVTRMSFDLEVLHNCFGDYIEIFDNNTVTHTSEKIGRYCGVVAPPSLTSSSNMLTILFVSDGSISAGGFTFSYIYTNSKKVCGGTYLTSSGVITSPGWPKNYPERKDCTWILKVPTGQQISLNVSSFDIESHTSCLGDYLDIRNGGYEGAPLIGKYCGVSIPKIIPSMSNSLYLHFHSDVFRVSSGFYITWESSSSGCGGVLTSPRGTIVSPDYPQSYGNNLECYWKISTSAGSVIDIIFADIDMEYQTDCIYDYLEVYDGFDGKSGSLGRFCSPQSHIGYIRSKTNHVFLKFHSDFQNAGHGFMINYNTVCNRNITGYSGVIESPNFPDDYPDNMDCVWKIVAPKGNKVNVTFSHFNLEERPVIGGNSSRLKYYLVYSSSQASTGPCGYDYVQLKDGNDLNYTNQLCGSEIPLSLFTSTDNQVFVHFHSDNVIHYSGFRIEWVVFGCGGYIKRPEGNFSSPDYPNNYPIDTECEWTIEVDSDQSIELQVLEFDMESSENCMFDSLVVYNGPTADYQAIGKICHTQKEPFIVTSTGNLMFIKFVTDSSFSGRGFKASFKAVPIKCGGLFSGAKGTIMSPDYPKVYGNNLECLWKIEVPKNHLVHFEIVDFDIANEDNGTCSDIFNVYNGDTLDKSLLIYSACGNSPTNIQNLTSASNTLLVELKTNNRKVAKGFKATYSLACGARIVTNSQGILNAHSALHTANDIENCSWTIISEQLDQKISLTMTHLDMNLAGDENCTLDGIKIYNGDSNSAPLYGSYCGTKIPSTIISSGNAITVFVGLTYSYLFSFSLDYSVLSTACGGALTSESGSFTSPSYPNSYPSNAECVWTLQTAPGNRLMITFTSFKIEESENCSEDYLEIRENDGGGKILGVYCGENIPTNTTIGAKLWIKFHSNSEITDSGFVADYSFVHGNEIFDVNNGTIASPLYPRRYVQSGEYFWRVTVEVGGYVLITFKEFGIDKISSECYYSLSIHDGYDESAPSLLNLCGNTLPDPVRTTSNMVYIKLSTDTISFGTLFLLEWRRVAREEEDTTFKKEACGSNLTTLVSPFTSTTLRSPGYPDGYKPNIRCEWIYETIPSHHLKIRFNDMSLEESSDCVLDKVSLFSGKREDSKWEQIDRDICLSNATSIPDIASGNRLKVTFETDMSANKTGFSAYIYADCGGSMYGPSGIIEPSFPNLTIYRYFYGVTRAMWCEWTVSVMPGRKIKLDFLNMNITNAESNKCNNYIMLRNGASQESPILGNGKYCGSDIPTDLLTSGNNLFVTYKGVHRLPFNASTQAFVLKYTEESTQCQHNIHLLTANNSEYISSPNYPNIPHPHTECTWLITAPPGHRLRIDFVDRFDLTLSSDCPMEYVEVRDGGTGISNLMGKYCVKAPGTLKSTSNIMLIKFVTDVTDPKNGFKAQVSIDICGGTIAESKGIIASPDILAMAFIKTDVECEWNIMGPGYHSIWININSLNLPNAPNCLNASLQVFDSIPLNTRNLTAITGKMCGANETLSIRSSANTATIKLFLSKQILANTNYNFLITFNTSREACGGIRTAPSGQIEASLSYYNGMRSPRFCEWRITVPRGRRIKLELLEGYQKNYLNTFRLAFYNDLHYVSLIRFAANETNRIIESSSNTMLIYYWYRTQSSQGKPFKAHYTSSEPSVCDSSFSGSEGVILPPSLNVSTYFCEYIYEPEPTDPRSLAQGKTLAMTFTSVTISERNAQICKFAASRISVLTDFDSDVTRLSRIADICSNSSAPVVISSPFIKTVVQIIQSNFKVNFRMNYKVNPCGGVINDLQDVTNIQLPSNLAGPINCVWSVKALKNRNVQIEIVESNFASHSCDSEFLVIRKSNGPQYGRVCHDHPLPTSVSSNNRLWLEYHADSFSAASKLQIKLSVDGSHLISWVLSCMKFLYHTFLAMNRNFGGDENIKQLNPQEINHLILCGDMLVIPNKTFHSPDYPKMYGNNQECIWTLRSDPGFKIKLEFEQRFFIEQSTNCSKDFIEIFDNIKGTWKSIGRECGRLLPKPYFSTSDKMKVLFRTDATTNGDGFQARWTVACGGNLQATEEEQTLSSPGFPVYTHNLNCTYKFIVPSGKYLSMNFTKFWLEEGMNSLCPFDNITLKRNSEDYEDYFGDDDESVYCGTKSPRYKRFLNGAFLRFKTDRFVQRPGFAIKYKIENCGGLINSTAMIHSPNENGMGYHDRLICLWNITAPPDKVVVVRFKSFILEHNPNCDFDSLAAFDGFEDEPYKRLALLCGNMTLLPPVIKSKTNKMLIKFETDSSNQFEGFAADVHFMLGESAGCGGNININKSETIAFNPMSASSPYDSFLDCHWIVKGPDDASLKIQFSSFNVTPCWNFNETSQRIDSCNCDFLEVRDGSGFHSPLIGRFCGDALPTEIVSSGNMMWLRFATDGVGSSTGIRSTLSVIPSPCGTTVLQVSRNLQEIVSPGYGSGIVARGIRCKWIIRSNDFSDEIYIRIKKIDLSPATVTTQQCVTDKLEITDAKHVTSTAVGEARDVINSGKMTFKKMDYMNFYNPYFQHIFCGLIDTPLDFYVRSEVVAITLTTSPQASDTYNGFKLSFSLSSCSRNLSDPQGRVSVNNIENNECTIRITAPSNYTISLYFTRLSIMSRDCDTDYFEVRDGLSNESPILNRYCTPAIPMPVFSTGNAMKIYATRNNEYKYVSFDFMYTITDKGKGCGGSLTSDSGSVYSAMYPSPYRVNGFCDWDITTPTGNTNVLKFNVFDLGSPSTCDTNYMELINRNDDVLTKFCPGDTPADFHSSENFIKIRHYTTVNNGGSGWVIGFQAQSDHI